MIQGGNYMKKFFKFIFDIHTVVGKICTGICVFLVIGGLLGLIFGTTKIQKDNEVVETNNFLNENVMLHNDNFSVEATRAYTANQIEILSKDKNTETKTGTFICVELFVTQTGDSKLEPHTLDTNDFKLKDHTGVYIPLNDIMSILDLHAIDVHIDSKDGGHVMSSANFLTQSAVKDYNYIDKVIDKEKIYNFVVYFDLGKNLKVEEELMVLEIDFFVGSNEYKRGSDIILLPRKNNIIIISKLKHILKKQSHIRKYF
jgi:hypothetical protein